MIDEMEGQRITVNSQRSTANPYNRRQTESNQVNLNCRGAKEEDRKVNRTTAKPYNRKPV